MLEQAARAFVHEIGTARCGHKYRARNVNVIVMCTGSEQSSQQKGRNCHIDQGPNGSKGRLCAKDC